jgi:hypothetical protein
MASAASDSGEPLDSSWSPAGRSVSDAKRSTTAERSSAPVVAPSRGSQLRIVGPDSRSAAVASPIFPTCANTSVPGTNRVTDVSSTEAPVQYVPLSFALDGASGTSAQTVDPPRGAVSSTDVP